MAELPELTILQTQMDEALRGRTIADVEILQEKCLNLPGAEFKRRLLGCCFSGVSRRGKWLILGLEPASFLLLNLGMGADLWRYEPPEEAQDRYQLRIGLHDGSGFTCRFWWFGYIRLLSPEELVDFREVAKLGPSPLEINAAEFAAILNRHTRKPAKELILNQEILSGVGNAYAHDILWKAGIHPQRRLGTLSESEVSAFYEAIGWVLNRAIDKGGIEQDFHRTGGKLKHWEAFGLVGYKKGKPCPRCGTAIEEIKTGSTKTYLCSQCQPLG
jgi:formamidopyrimidine-DNA glycosylase